MMNTKICMFDNNTGKDIPTKIDVYPVTIILGSTVNEVHEKAGSCSLFGVITHLSDDMDIIVSNENDKKSIESILKFGNKKCNVELQESSMWYNKKATKNIIISDSINLSNEDLSLVLSMYIKDISLEKKKNTPVEMYIVKNSRSSKEILRTPNISDAKRICDTTPCGVVVTRDNKVVYNARYGRASTNIKKSTQSFKSKQVDSNGVYHFSVKIN